MSKKRSDEPLFGGCQDLALMIVGVFVLAVAMGSCLIGMVTQ